MRHTCRSCPTPTAIPQGPMPGEVPSLGQRVKRLLGARGIVEDHVGDTPSWSAVPIDVVEPILAVAELAASVASSTIGRSCSSEVRQVVVRERQHVAAVGQDAVDHELDYALPPTRSTTACPRVSRTRSAAPGGTGACGAACGGCSRTPRSTPPPHAMRPSMSEGSMPSPVSFEYLAHPAVSLGPEGGNVRVARGGESGHRRPPTW